MKACTCANRGDANAALHVEHSLFPRKRTLLGRARERQREKSKNAARNKLMTQAKEANNKMHNNLGDGSQPENKKNLNNPDMICTLDSRAEKADNMSTGVSVSRTSRSCFNSTAGPTGTTTVPASANVSIAQMETTDDDSSPKIRVINGNLAPPRIMSKSSANSTTSAEK